MDGSYEAKLIDNFKELDFLIKCANRILDELNLTLYNMGTDNFCFKEYNTSDSEESRFDLKMLYDFDTKIFLVQYKNMHSWDMHRALGKIMQEEILDKGLDEILHSNKTKELNDSVL